MLARFNGDSGVILGRSGFDLGSICAPPRRGIAVPWRDLGLVLVSEATRDNGRKFEAMAVPTDCDASESYVNTDKILASL